MQNRILVVVPCFNEEATIADVVYDLKKIEHLEVCVVNDGSTDQTSEIVRGILDVTLINFPFNLGISEALRASAILAVTGNYDFLIQCDGDGQHDSKAVWKLVQYAIKLSVAGEKDFVVIGSRFTNGYTESKSTTDLRIYGSKLLRFMLRRMHGLDSSDPTSGLRLYSGSTVPFLIANYPTIWPETIFLGRLWKAEFPVYETHVLMNLRAGGESKLGGMKAGVFMLKVSIAIMVDKLFWKNDRAL
jgi:glycosyltransferase involved in cell wall biosynthesis